MKKTSIAIDEDLLDDAQRVLNTTSMKETVELALLEVVRADARRREVQALAAMEGMDLADEEIMSRAWRS